MKKKPKKAAAPPRPQVVRSIKEVLRGLSARQRAAVEWPVPVGAEVDRFSGRPAVQVMGAAEFHTRVVFAMAGSPELLGPCWMVEVKVQRAPARVALVVSDWTPAEQMMSKELAMAAIRGVGHGDTFDVQVRDCDLRIWRLARVDEAKLAEARMMARAKDAEVPW